LASAVWFASLPVNGNPAALPLRTERFQAPFDRFSKSVSIYVHPSLEISVFVLSAFFWG
jgi:hypothetical protein